MLRFVVLRHDKDGVHYDFMIEWGDRLRTWALAEAIGPGLEIRARALPDHRTIYLDYEGEISGGRGSVRRVDRGTYELLEGSPSSLRLRLRGERFAGEVVLDRQETGGY